MLNFNPDFMEWTKKAACAYNYDPDLWHYESSRYEEDLQTIALGIAIAKSVCENCPVKNECLKMGLEEENLVQIGNYVNGSVYGGKMLIERIAIKTGKPMPMRAEWKLLQRVNKHLKRISQ